MNKKSWRSKDDNLEDARVVRRRVLLPVWQWGSYAFDHRHRLQKKLYSCRSKSHTDCNSHFKSKKINPGSNIRTIQEFLQRDSTKSLANLCCLYLRRHVLFCLSSYSEKIALDDVTGLASFPAKFCADVLKFLNNQMN